MAQYDKQKMLVACVAKVKETWQKAYGIWGDKIGAIPVVEMNARLTSTAGRAFMLTAWNQIHHPNMVERMDFSCFLMQNNWVDFLAQTVPHECAHFIALRVYGDENHGRGFKYVMQELGCRVERCHSYQTKSQMEKAATPRKRITSRV